MKNFMNMLSTDIYKAIKSWHFLAGVLGTVFVYLLIIKPEINFASDVLYYYRISVEFVGVYHLMFILMCTIPYGTSFCREFNSNNIKYSVVRSSVNSYSWSKVISCAIVGGLAVAFGTLIFIFCASFFRPLVDSTRGISEGYLATTGGELLSEGKYILYFSIYICLSFFKGFLWSVVGLLVSAYIPNIFVALSSPFILAYVYRITAAALHIKFNVEDICNGNVRNFIGGSSLLTLAVGILKIICITFLLGMAFNRKVNRRIANE